ncbi:hypothetical protein [Lysobacter enzymogenes]|uniref:hypothetical protein n=1 Tax=Lysobacter enzymogenes TaxID=69 RepID=UPI0019D04FDD|nr:hypothetical protein [Lysobacter enzymogenes]
MIVAEDDVAYGALYLAGSVVNASAPTFNVIETCFAELRSCVCIPDCWQKVTELGFHALHSAQCVSAKDGEASGQGRQTFLLECCKVAKQVAPELAQSNPVFVFSDPKDNSISVAFDLRRELEKFVLKLLKLVCVLRSICLVSLVGNPVRCACEACSDYAKKKCNGDTGPISDISPISFQRTKFHSRTSPVHVVEQFSGDLGGPATGQSVEGC